MKATTKWGSWKTRFPVIEGVGMAGGKLGHDVTPGVEVVVSVRTVGAVSGAVLFLNVVDQIVD